MSYTSRQKITAGFVSCAALFVFGCATGDRSGKQSKFIKVKVYETVDNPDGTIAKDAYGNEILKVCPEAGFGLALADQGGGNPRMILGPNDKLSETTTTTKTTTTGRAADAPAKSAEFKKKPGIKAKRAVKYTTPVKKSVTTSKEVTQTTTTYAPRPVVSGPSDLQLGAGVVTGVLNRASDAALIAATGGFDGEEIGDTIFDVSSASFSKSKSKSKSRSEAKIEREHRRGFKPPERCNDKRRGFNRGGKKFHY